MRHTSSSRKRDIEAEVQARRQAAYQAMLDKRQMDEATALVEAELGGVEIPTS